MLSSSSSPSILSSPGPSRTTQWRHRKAQKSAEPAGRKQYSCRVCGNPMSGHGHTQFQGQRYCPQAPNQIAIEEWLAVKREEAKLKAEARKK